jgi:hypothetical protein
MLTFSDLLYRYYPLEEKPESFYRFLFYSKKLIFRYLNFQMLEKEVIRIPENVW